MRGWGRCLKVTLQTHLPENFHLHRQRLNFNVIYVRRCSQLRQKLRHMLKRTTHKPYSIAINVTKHSIVRLFRKNIPKGITPAESQTYLQSVIRLNHIINDLAPACRMCGKRIANKEDLKRHMTFKATYLRSL